MWTARPDHADARQVGRDRVEPLGLAQADAELVVVRAGGDLGVATGADVGIDAENRVLAAALGGGDPRQRVQLALGLDVDLVEADVDGEGELLVGLADAGEDDRIAGMPAAIALRISPSETVSAPAPSRASVCRTARLLLAFIAKKTRDFGAPTALAKRL